MRAIVLLLSLVALVVRADPYTGFYYPASIQAGTTNRLVVGGQRLWNIKGGWISGEGVEVVKIERTRNFPVVNGKGQSAWLDKWLMAIYAGCPERPPLEFKNEKDILSWTRHPWWEKMNELPPLELSMVARYLNTPRNPLQMSPSLSERLIVTVVASLAAKPGVRDIALYDDRGASAPHPLFVTKLPHASEPLYRPPRAKQLPARSAILLPVVLDGQILPGETDVFRLRLTRGAASFALIGRELQPYLGDAVPGFFNPTLRLTDEKGSEIGFADDFYYLPDPVLNVRVPADGDYRLEVRDNLYRGRDDFVYSITCTQEERGRFSPQDRAFVCSPCPLIPSVRSVADGTVRSDVLELPAETVTYDFQVKSPGTWDFELFARRLGSPLDGLMRLYGPLGNDGRSSLLATWDDVTNEIFVGSVPQAECDPVGRWRFEKPGSYRLSVADRTGSGGAHHRYRLRFGPASPSFEIYAQKSSFVLHQKDQSAARTKLKIVRNNGFSDAIEIQDTEDFLVRPKRIPPGTNECEVSFLPVRRDWTGLKRCAFKATARVGERTLEAPVVPADEAEQAFAYTHFVPARAFSFEMLEIYGELPEYPTWIKMPSDEFLPRKVLRTHAELVEKKTDYAAGLDALSLVEIPIAPIPANFGDGILAAKFASSAAAVRARRDVVAFSPSKGDAQAPVRAALAGVTRFIHRDMTYADEVVAKPPFVFGRAALCRGRGRDGARPSRGFATATDGNARCQRVLARAATEASDNDVLLYVPSGDVNPLAGEVGRVARALRDEGWCFDYVTDFTLEKAPLVRKYRAVVLPPLKRPLSEKNEALLEEFSQKRGCALVCWSQPVKERQRKLSAAARRERMPTGVRFARFGNKWGEAWYLVCNTGRKTLTEPLSFNMRGRALHAVLLSIDSGRVSNLERRGKSSFTCPLLPGESAWIFVTARAFRHNNNPLCLAAFAPLRPNFGIMPKTNKGLRGLR